MPLRWRGRLQQTIEILVQPRQLIFALADLVGRLGGDIFPFEGALIAER